MHMDESAIAANFEDTAWHSEAPNPDANGIGKLAMSEVVHSKGFKVVITGTLPRLPINDGTISDDLCLLQEKEQMNISLDTLFSPQITSVKLITRGRFISTLNPIEKRHGKAHARSPTSFTWEKPLKTYRYQQNAC